MLATLRQIVLEFSQEAELQNALERMVNGVKKSDANRLLFNLSR
jgi:phosphotransferase system enzyme I (PtsP)